MILKCRRCQGKWVQLLFQNSKTRQSDSDANVDRFRWRKSEIRPCIGSVPVKIILSFNQPIYILTFSSLSSASMLFDNSWKNVKRKLYLRQLGILNVVPILAASGTKLVANKLKKWKSRLKPPDFNQSLYNSKQLHRRSESFKFRKRIWKWKFRQISVIELIRIKVSLNLNAEGTYDFGNFYNSGCGFEIFQIDFNPW